MSETIERTLSEPSYNQLAALVTQLKQERFRLRAELRKRMESERDAMLLAVSRLLSADKIRQVREEETGKIDAMCGPGDTIVYHKAAASESA